MLQVLLDFSPFVARVMTENNLDSEVMMELYDVTFEFPVTNVFETLHRPSFGETDSFF